MFRQAQNPPVPQPRRPPGLTNEEAQSNLSFQVQRILAVVLPQPVVTVLAAISDLLYRVLLDKPNEPPTYTSTLAPPILLIVVTYLAFMLIYKSIRSFFGVLFFSLKWAVILGVVGFAVSWHYGNGNVQQGAHHLAQQSGLQSASWTDVLRKYPVAGQLAPILSNVPNGLGMAAGALPSLHDAQEWFSSQYNQQQQRQPDSFNSKEARRQNVREYRDLRPSKNSPAGVDISYVDQAQQVSSSTARQRKSSRGTSTDSQPKLARNDNRNSPHKQESQDSYLSKMSRWMGADFDSTKKTK